MADPCDLDHFKTILTPLKVNPCDLDHFKTILTPLKVNKTMEADYMCVSNIAASAMDN
jgi:hypothetical protein